MFARRESLPHILAVIEDAQIAHIRQVGVGNIEQAVTRAGRQHQVAVVEGSARRELQFARGTVNRNSMIGDQVDVLVCIEFCRPEHQAVRPAGAFQVSLGQWRPLIGQMRLVIDQIDGLLEARLSQRRRELKARMAGADDDNGSCHHASDRHDTKRQAVEAAQRIVETAASARPSLRTTQRAWRAHQRWPRFRAAPPPARHNREYRCRRSYARSHGA